MISTPGAQNRTSSRELARGDKQSLSVSNQNRPMYVLTVCYILSVYLCLVEMSTSIHL